MKPLFLVTNDDGASAHGIIALEAALSELGEVVVVAPHANRSGVSHAISLLAPLRVTKLKPSWYEVDGTPADCVYLAIHELLGRRPQVVVSGVNAGPNLSFDVHYSGTLAGALEGSLQGIPSVAVSLTDVHGGSFDHAAAFTRALVAHVLETGLPAGTVLNVNVPGGRPTKHQLTFLGHRLFRHSVHKREDPRGGVYYWIGGVPDRPRDIPGSDCHAIDQGYISVSPVTADLTDLRTLRSSPAVLELSGSEAVPRVDPVPELVLEFDTRGSLA